MRDMILEAGGAKLDMVLGVQQREEVISVMLDVFLELCGLAVSGRRDLYNVLG